MSDETGTNETEETEFPGESEVEVEATEAAGQPAEGSGSNGPWIVVTISEQALKDGGRIIADQVDGTTFKLQIEADAWIKENAEEGAIYASMRKGKLVRAKVVRKVEEI